MKKILIVEDHPLVSESTKDLLLKIDASLEVVIRSTAKSAIECINSDNPWHRIFMDIDVPGAYGLTLARTFQQFGLAEISTIVTAFNNPQWRLEAEQIGMLGYIIKATPYSQYINSLNSVLNGIRVFPEPGQSTDNSPQLTRRQVDMLCLLHKGLSTSEIAKQLCVTQGHVNNVFQTLKGVLHANNRSHVISRAIELGYINVHDYQKR